MILTTSAPPARPCLHCGYWPLRSSGVSLQSAAKNWRRKDCSRPLIRALQSLKKAGSDASGRSPRPRARRATLPPGFQWRHTRAGTTFVHKAGGSSASCGLRAQRGRSVRLRASLPLQGSLPSACAMRAWISARAANLCGARAPRVLAYSASYASRRTGRRAKPWCTLCAAARSCPPDRGGSLPATVVSACSMAYSRGAAEAAWTSLTRGVAPRPLRIFSAKCARAVAAASAAAVPPTSF